MTVSVLIPTFNYAHYIYEAISSIRTGISHDIIVEIIVVDDGSTDNTKKRLETFIETGAVRYHHQTNSGKAAATRKGIELATGDIIFNLDADDYFLPGKIVNTIKLFEQYPGLVHVAGPAKIIYDIEMDRKPESENIPSTLLEKPIKGDDLLRFFFENKLLFGGGSTFAARASALKQIKWDDAVDMYADEWLLIATLMKGDSYLMLEPLSVWRVHGNNYSGKPSLEKRIDKQLRMEKSSAAILSLLERGGYPAWLLKLYQLKHEVRRLVWLEENRQKSMSDMVRFFRNSILAGHSFHVLHRYHAFNRLIPDWVRKTFKD